MRHDKENTRRRRTMLELAALALAAALMLPSCQNLAPSGDAVRVAPAHKNWWNYYERGLEAVAAGQWTNAVQDFQTCLGTRPGARFGNVREQWWARTYGVRFLNGYFPHRELGIALLNRGQTQAAVAELEESIRQEPSGRAKHFLNEARRAVQTGRNLPAPRIILDAPDGSASPYCRSPFLQVEGLVAAEGRVARIEINGASEFIELADPEKRFTREIALNPGTNTIHIQAADLNGRTATSTLRRIADWRGPTFSVLDVQNLNGVLTVEGRVVDDYAIKSVALNNSTSPLTQTRRDNGTIWISLALGEAERPVLEAEDEAGNRLNVDLRDVLSRLMPQVAEAAPSPFPSVQTSRAWAPDRVERHRVIPPQVLAAPVGKARDALKPVLRLRPDADCLEVHVREFYLEGDVGDPGGVASVTVNGQEFLAPTDPGSRIVSFNGILPLDYGTNRFTVVAEDMAENRSERAFTVLCSVPDHLNAAYRMAVGIPPFSPPGDAWAWQARSQLQQAFVRTPARFRLLERDEGWDYILRELGMSVSDLADQRAALRIGRLLSAELLFIGASTSHGEGVTVQVRVVDSTDGSILFTTDVYADRPQRDLAYQLGGLFLKIMQEFPIVEGRIVDVKGGEVDVDVGARGGVRVGSKFVVARRVGDAGDLAILESSNQTVILEVDKVSPSTIHTRVYPADAVKLLAKGDRIYAR